MRDGYFYPGIGRVVNAVDKKQTGFTVRPATDGEQVMRYLRFTVCTAVASFTSYYGRSTRTIDIHNMFSYHRTCCCVKYAVDAYKQ